MKLNDLEKAKLRVHITLFVTAILMCIGIAGVFLYGLFAQQLTDEAASSLESLEVQAVTLETEKDLLLASTADIDGNGKVDMKDFQYLSEQYNKKPASPSADLDKNGKVNIYDFSIFSSQSR